MDQSVMRSRLFVVTTHGGPIELHTAEQLALELADIGKDHIDSVTAFESIDLASWTEIK
jgi:hypothetical protein